MSAHLIRARDFATRQIGCGGRPDPIPREGTRDHPSGKNSVTYACRALTEAWVGLGVSAETVFFSLRLADSNTNLNLSHFWFPMDSCRSCRTLCVSNAAVAISSILYPSDMSLKCVKCETHSPCSSHAVRIVHETTKLTFWIVCLHSIPTVFGAFFLFWRPRMHPHHVYIVSDTHHQCTEGHLHKTDCLQFQLKIQRLPNSKNPLACHNCSPFVFLHLSSNFLSKVA